MPIDLRLFPTVYPATCPGVTTAVPVTVDPISDIERLLYLTRQQSSASIRDAMKAIAALQNQTIPNPWNVLATIQPPAVKAVTIVNNYITNPAPAPLPSPPVTIPTTPITAAPVVAQPPPTNFLSVGKAFYGGGNNNGVHWQIDRCWIGAVHITPTSLRLFNPRYRHAGLTSNLDGYWCGGQTDPNPSIKTTDIEAIRFATDQRRQITTFLTVARSYCLGLWNPTQGFVLASHNPNLSSIDRMDFANDAVTLWGQSLPNSVGGLSGSSYPAGPSNAYVASGFNGSLIVQRFNLTTGVPTALSAQLTVIRNKAASSSSTVGTHFYGGQSTVNSVVYRSGDRLNYAGEGLQAAWHRLETEKFDLSALSTHNKAIIAGGQNKNVTAVEVHDYFSNLLITESARLTRGGNCTVPVGKP